MRTLVMKRPQLCVLIAMLAAGGFAHAAESSQARLQAAFGFSFPATAAPPQDARRDGAIERLRNEAADALGLKNPATSAALREREAQGLPASLIGGAESPAFNHSLALIARFDTAGQRRTGRATPAQEANAAEAVAGGAEPQSGPFGPGKPAPGRRADPLPAAQREDQFWTGDSTGEEPHLALPQPASERAQPEPEMVALAAGPAPAPGESVPPGHPPRPAHSDPVQAQREPGPAALRDVEISLVDCDPPADPPAALLAAHASAAQAQAADPDDDAARFGSIIASEPFAAESLAALAPSAAESLAVPAPLVERLEWDERHTAAAGAFENREMPPVSDGILAGAASRNPAAAAPEAAPAAANENKVVAFGGQELLAAGDSALENTRGGFDSGNGLLVSFGITRVAYINGNLATTTSFNIADVGKVTPEQASALSKQLGSLNLVQNGAGNSFQPSLTSSPGTVIQNTLSNQTIMTKTVIDASANSSGLLRNLNTQRTLTEALGSALRR